MDTDSDGSLEGPIGAGEDVAALLWAASGRSNNGSGGTGGMGAKASLPAPAARAPPAAAAVQGSMMGGDVDDDSDDSEFGGNMTEILQQASKITGRAAQPVKTAPPATAPTYTPPVVTHQPPAGPAPGRKGRLGAAALQSIIGGYDPEAERRKQEAEAAAQAEAEARAAEEARLAEEARQAEIARQEAARQRAEEDRLAAERAAAEAKAAEEAALRAQQEAIRKQAEEAEAQKRASQQAAIEKAKREAAEAQALAEKLEAEEAKKAAQQKAKEAPKKPAPKQPAAKTAPKPAAKPKAVQKAAPAPVKRPAPKQKPPEKERRPSKPSSAATKGPKPVTKRKESPAPAPIPQPAPKSPSTEEEDVPGSDEEEEETVDGPAGEPTEEVVEDSYSHTTRSPSPHHHHHHHRHRHSSRHHRRSSKSRTSLHETMASIQVGINQLLEANSLSLPYSPRKYGGEPMDPRVHPRTPSPTHRFGGFSPSRGTLYNPYLSSRLGLDEMDPHGVDTPGKISGVAHSHRDLESKYGRSVKHLSGGTGTWGRKECSSTSEPWSQLIQSGRRHTLHTSVPVRSHDAVVSGYAKGQPSPKLSGPGKGGGERPGYAHIHHSSSRGENNRAATGPTGPSARHSKRTGAVDDSQRVAELKEHLADTNNMMVQMFNDFSALLQSREEEVASLRKKLKRERTRNSSPVAEQHRDRRRERS